MKRLFIVLATLTITASSTFAQEEFISGQSDRLIIDLFSDIWSNAPSDMEMNTINRGINISMLQDFQFGSSSFSFAAGLGFSSHNLYSDHYFKFILMSYSSTYPQPGTFDFSKIDDGDGEVKKNKISLNYLNIPLEFRYRNNSLPSTFRVSAGVRAGYLVNAHTKTHIVNDDGVSGAGFQEEWKYKEHKLGNIEKFQFGVTGRIGYGRVNLNAYLPLTKIFKDNSVTDMKPFSLGLTFIVY